MTLFCSVDIETTGLDPTHSDVLEIGAVIDLTQDPYSDETRAEFHCYVVEDLYQGEPSALAMHPTIFKRIANKEEPYAYYSPAEAIFRFSTWLVENWKAASERPVLFAGKNFAQFDLPFLQAMPAFNESIQYEHGVLDPGPLFLDPEKDSKIPNTMTCCVRAGITYFDGHTALDDAMQVRRLIQQYYSKKSNRGWIWPKRRKTGTR